MGKSNKKNKSKSKKISLTSKELDALVQKEAKKLAKKIVDKKVEKAVEKALAKAAKKASPKKSPVTKTTPVKATPTKAVTKTPSVAGKTSLDFNAREAMIKIRSLRTVAAINKFTSNETRSTVLKVKEAKIIQLSKK